MRVLGGRVGATHRPGAATEGEEMGGHAGLWRLQAPGRDTPGIDPHQHRTPRPDLRARGSDTKKCSATGWLCVTKRRLNRCGW